MIGCGPKMERGVLTKGVRGAVEALGRMAVPAGMRGGRMMKKSYKRKPRLHKKK